MNAPPPEASYEYSRGLSHPDSVPRAGSDARSRAPAPRRGPVIGAILAGGLLGAALLVLAEFTPLFKVHAAGRAAAVETVSTGSHQTYALLPIAALAAALAFGVWRDRSRPALLALGLLGVIALLIALLGDLPDAQATGLIRSSVAQYADASSTPALGLYLETLGAVALVVTCVSGFILIGPGAVARAAPARPRGDGDRPAGGGGSPFDGGAGGGAGPGPGGVGMNGGPPTGAPPRA